MPVMCMLRAPGVTPADYDTIRAYLEWEASPPSGGLAHFITFQDDEALEVDVWESEDAFRAFYDGAFAPACRRFGLTVCEPEVLELHNMALAEPAKAYMLTRAYA
jgi:hypothetical protein